MFIDYGTQIENLIGSNYDDALIGSHANNHIYGGKGADRIDAGLGDDYLDGGLGANTLIGGAGQDIYIIDNKNDQIIETHLNEIDMAYSLVNYTLPDNVE